ncbi:hypothetical protein Tco_1555732 [Tanacetum coccineum]
MDSVIPLRQKNTLAEYMILSGADNRPPILDKDLYDLWKSRMELYMQNREHIRMILELVDHGPLIWSAVEENKLINDMNIYNMKMEKFQVNTKFLNSLPPEWSKFVTDVKLVKDLHTTNFDQLHAYLEQHELHANKVRLLREHNPDPLAFVANQQMTPPHFNTYQSSYNNPQLQQQFPPSQYGLAVTVFSPGDDPIACLKKEMAFLIAAASSRVTVQHVQGDKGKVILVLVIRVMLLVLGETMQVDRKGMLNAITSKEAGQILDEEQLAFLADPGVPDGQVVQTIIPNNAAFQTEDLDTYDSDCDDISNAKAVLMANISNYGSDVISEIPHSETYLNDIENQSVHAMQDFEQTLVVDVTDNEIKVIAILFRTLNICKKHCNNSHFSHLLRQ